MDRLPGPRRRLSRRMHAPSENWRREFLSRCALRFKESRAKAIMECRRGRASEHQEMEGDLLGDAKFHRYEGINALSRAEEEELILELQAMLDEERRKEEAALIEHAEEEDNEDIEELVRWQERMKIEEEPVGILCPVCEKSRLRLNRGVLFCRCGVRFSAARKENLTEDMVRRRLADVLEEHCCRPCTGKPLFQVRKDYGFEFLHMQCRSCDEDVIVF